MCASAVLIRLVGILLFHCLYLCSVEMFDLKFEVLVFV